MWQRNPARSRQFSGNFGPEHWRYSPGELGITADRPQRPAFRPGPCARIRNQRAKHRMVELVTATHRAVRAEQRPSRQSEVANCIQHLMAHELVGETGTFRIEDAIVGYDEGVLE